MKSLQPTPKCAAIVKAVTPDGMAGFDQFNQFIIAWRELGDKEENYSYSHFWDCRGMTCKICGNGWQNTTESLRNQSVLDNGKFIAHNTCVEGYRNLRDYYEFGALFTGKVRYEGLTEISGGYSKSVNWYEAIPMDFPQYKFTIGWRKRVIHVEVSGITDDQYNRFLQLFLNEDVTRTGRYGDSNILEHKFYLHAWGMEKAKEYIDIMVKELGVEYKRNY